MVLMLLALRTLPGVIEVPMVTVWSVPDPKFIVPVKLFPTATVPFSNWYVLRIVLEFVAQLLTRVSLFDEPPKTVVVSGRFRPAGTLIVNVLPTGLPGKVLPPGPRLTFRLLSPL